MGEKRRLEASSQSEQQHHQKRRKSNDGAHRPSQSQNTRGRNGGNYSQPTRNGHGPVPPKKAFPVPRDVALPPIHDEQLRRAVFTHTNARSTKDAGARDDTMTYEPLEFLGDAYIELFATRLIHDSFPSFNTGERSQTREMLVKNETLAEFSKLYGWDKAGVLLTSGQEREEGGLRWTKMLGDVFEAYVGAIVEDDKRDGFATAELWLQRLWQPYLSQVKAKSVANPRINVGELKDKLQNLLMNPRAGVKIEFVHAAPPRVDEAKGQTRFTKKVVLTGWGHTSRTLGRGVSMNSKTADGLAIQDAFTNNMDLILAANKLKKDFEERAKAEQASREAADTANV